MFFDFYPLENQVIQFPFLLFARVLFIVIRTNKIFKTETKTVRQTYRQTHAALHKSKLFSVSDILDLIVLKPMMVHHMKSNGMIFPNMLDVGNWSQVYNFSQCICNSRNVWCLKCYFSWTAARLSSHSAPVQGRVLQSSRSIAEIPELFPKMLINPSARSSKR